MTIEQIDKLIKDLEDNLDWSIAYEWESPIDLSDNLFLAIEGLKELKQWHKLLNTEEGYPVNAKKLKRAEIQKKIDMLKKIMKKR